MPTQYIHKMIAIQATDPNHVESPFFTIKTTVLPAPVISSCPGQFGPTITQIFEITLDTPFFKDSSNTSTTQAVAHLTSAIRAIFKPGSSLPKEFKKRVIGDLGKPYTVSYLEAIFSSAKALGIKKLFFNTKDLTGNCTDASASRIGADGLAMGTLGVLKEMRTYVKTIPANGHILIRFDIGENAAENTQDIVGESELYDLRKTPFEFGMVNCIILKYLTDKGTTPIKVVFGERLLNILNHPDALDFCTQNLNSRCIGMTLPTIVYNHTTLSILLQSIQTQPHHFEPELGAQANYYLQLINNLAVPPNRS
jgi:hypothetical protein